MTVISSPENKEQALQSISQMIKEFDISLKDIQRTQKTIKNLKTNTKDIKWLNKLLGYLGAAFIFGGLCLLIGMIWSDLGSAARVIISYGSGLCAFICGYVFTRDERYTNLSFPFYLISVFLLPFGMFVFLHEYAGGNDAQLAIIIVFGILAIQFALPFLKDKKTSLLFFAYLFFYISLATLLDRLHIPRDWAGMGMGLSIIGFALYFDKTIHRLICPFWYFVGGITYLSAISLMMFKLDLPNEVTGITIGLSAIFMAWHLKNNKYNITAIIFYVLGTLGFLFSLIQIIQNQSLFGLLIGISIIGFILNIKKPEHPSSYLFWHLVGIFTYLTSISNIMMFNLYLQNELIGIIIGLTVMLLGWDFKKSQHNIIAPIFYILGSLGFLFSLFEAVESKPFFDLIFLAVAVYMMIISVRVKSRGLLVISTFAIIGFLGYFTKEYFADVTGWPIALIIFGFFLIGTSHYALKLGKKIKSPA